VVYVDVYVFIFQEMACLSVFMQGSASPRAYQFHYMDSTITTYLTICKLVLSISVDIVGDNK